MILHLSCWYSLTCPLSKDINSLVELLRNQFFGLYFRLYYFFLLILNLPFFYYFLHFYYSFSLNFFFLSLLTSFLHSSSFSLYFFAILVCPFLVSTAFHTSLSILSLLLLFFSQFQNCSMLAIIFPKSLFTFVLQSYQFLFFLYALNNKYSPLLYAQSVSPY